MPERSAGNAVRKLRAVRGWSRPRGGAAHVTDPRPLRGAAPHRTPTGSLSPSSRAARRSRWWGAARDFARRRWVRGTVTVLVLALCSGFLLRSFARDQDATGAALGELGPLLPLALVPAVAGLWLTALSWREPLQTLAVPLSRASAVRIFAAGQLGKYVPGVMWSIVLQTRLAAASGITVLHFTAAFGVYAAVSLSTGAALGLPALARYAHGGGAAVLAAALAPMALFLLPRALTAAVRLLTAVPALARRLAPVPYEALRRSVWLCALSWAVTGVHLWLFAVALGADPLDAVLPCLAGFAVATSLASVVIVVPDGLGVREALLAVSLASVLPAPEAAVAAAASRLVLAAADVLAFGYGSLAVRGAGPSATDSRPRAEAEPPPAEPPPPAVPSRTFALSPTSAPHPDTPGTSVHERTAHADDGLRRLGDGPAPHH